MGVQDAVVAIAVTTNCCGLVEAEAGAASGNTAPVSMMPTPGARRAGLAPVGRSEGNFWLRLRLRLLLRLWLLLFLLLLWPPSSCSRLPCLRRRRWCRLPPALSRLLDRLWWPLLPWRWCRRWRESSSSSSPEYRWRDEERERDRYPRGFSLSILGPEVDDFSALPGEFFVISAVWPRSSSKGS